MARLYVVAFSKDRPFQLLHALKTTLAYVQAPSVRIVVIYSTIGASSQEYAAAYDEVAHYFPQTTFVLEEEGRFFDQLKEAAFEEAGEGDAIMWLVDDLLFYRHLDAAAAMELLEQGNREEGSCGGKKEADRLTSRPFPHSFLTDERVFAVHPKLHPGIVYSHTQDQVFSVPELSWSPIMGDRGFVYQRGGAEGEWDYPWDLCGSIYRVADVKRLLSCLESVHGSDGVSNPNRLEYLGNKLLRSKGGAGGLSVPPCCACWSRPVLSVVTVNRVQDVYSTPVYGSGEGDKVAATVEELEALRKAGVRLDDTAYARASWGFLAVHIGDLYTMPAVPEEPGRQGGGGGGIDSDGVGVSVLVPVWNGEAHLEAALRSVLGQGIPEGWGLEVLVVDDGSDDGSVALARRLAEEEEEEEEEEDGRVVRVITTDQHQGLVHALNTGVREARYDVIARMDADDVCAPGRFLAQIEYLQQHPECQAVGGGALVMTEDGSKGGGGGGSVTRVSMQPCHPRLVHWSLLFSCTICHPTVMFRRSKAGVGSRGLGYDQDAFPAEDYDLWLRLSGQPSPSERGSCLPFANVPLPCVYLRRHDSSVTVTRREEQAASACSAAHRAVERALGGEKVEAAVVEAMRRPEEAASLERLVQAADLMLRLEEVYVDKHGGTRAAAAQWQEGGEEDRDRVGVMLLRRDVGARLKAMSAIGVANFGPAAIPLVMKLSARK